MKTSNKSKKKKFIKIGIPVLVILIVAGIIAAPRIFKGEEVKTFSTFELDKSDLEETISAGGKIESVESSNVSAVGEGKIKRIYVKEGQYVKKGQLLAETEDGEIQREIKKTLSADNAELKNAELNKNIKAKDLENAKFLYELGEISQDELRRAENEYNIAVLEHSGKLTGTDVSHLRDQLNDTKILSPISGTVTSSKAKIGAPGTGVLFVVENRNDLILNMKISEYDINSVQIGQKVIVNAEMIGEKEMQGTVSYVGDAAIKAGEQAESEAPEKVEFKVSVAITNPDPGLKIGASARGKITVKEKKDILAVPMEALIKHKGGYAVVEAVKSGKGFKARIIPVKIGLETDFSTEISGAQLKKGMLLVSNPKGLKNGQKIVM